MEQPAMKQAKIYVGVCVDGAAVMARVMIRADHDVCKYCLGSGRDQNDEECEACEGLGTVAQLEGQE
jgi:DnaJ-class molecular chaperone